MKDIEVLKFNSVAEYQEWLSHQSYAVKTKAARFHKKFGENTVPVVVIMDADTCTACWGPDAVSHLFINPARAQEILENIIASQEEEP